MKESKFIKEFREFIARGNVIDMAVGVVVGGAFTTIVNSLVNDILNPIIGFIIGGVDFTDLKIVISQAVGDTPEVAIRYGAFVQNIINFLIVAFAIFCLVKAINKMHENADKLLKKDKKDAAEAEEK